MSDTQLGFSTGREKAAEERVLSPVMQASQAAHAYAANAGITRIADMQGSMVGHDGHLVGGGQGAMTTIGDDLLDKGVAEAASPIEQYAAGKVSEQGIEGKYLNPTTMGNDAFAASMDIQSAAQMQAHFDMPAAELSGSELMAASVPSPSFGGTEAPEKLTDATIQSARGGVFGDANPVTGKEAQGGSPMDAAKAEVRASGAIETFRESGASMGKQSLSGDGGKPLGAAPTVTPGQKEFTATKRDPQSELVSAGR